MKTLILVFLCSIPAFGAACTMQTINGSDTISSGPAKINANFTCLNLNTPKVFSGSTVPATVTGSRFGDFYLRTGTNTTYQCFSVTTCTTVAAGNWVLIAGTGGGGGIPVTTSALRGNGAGAAVAVTGTGSDCVHVDGSSAACPGGGGTGTVTVVGSGNLTSTECVTGGGSQTIQTPSANCTVDSSGNLTANSFSSSDTSHSSEALFNGVTSGTVGLAAADIAGTAIVYVLPSTNGVSGQFLKDNGVVACPTLAAGSPSVCHQLTWGTGGGGGTGCVPTGSSGQILVDDGAGACLSSTPTISGSTITASLTGHASLDAPLASPTFTGTVTIPNGGVFGTPTSMTATNVTGLPLTTGVTGTLSNGNTTATSANTASAIVARDGSGNFTAGTITAALTGNASTASAVAVGGITGLGTGVATALAANVSGSGAICLASGSACAGGGGGSFVLLEQHTASTSNSLDFTTCFSSTYDDYEFRIVGIAPTTDGTVFRAQFGTGAGPTYDTAGNYNWTSLAINPAGGFGNGNATDTSMAFTTTTNNTANYVVGGRYTVSNPGGATARSGGALDVWDGGGFWLNTTAATAIRFFFGTFATNTIASGTIRCYGIAK